MLTRNHRQEALARAYVQAIAACCGLGCSARDFDYGIDITLHDIQHRARRYVESGFKLDIQAKSTILANRTATEVLYDIDVKNYDDLRDPFVGCPRVLVVLVLPEDEAEWLHQDQSQLLIRSCAYWLSLKGFPPTKNRKTVRISLPVDNVLSVAAMTGLMTRVREREEL
jgi:hypothetical protein